MSDDSKRSRTKQDLINYASSTEYPYKQRRDNAQACRDKRRVLTQWYNEVKSTLECIICGEKDPNKLHFHHRDPKTKVASICRMITGRFAKQRILDEMAKCDPLCKSCHIAFHYMHDGSLYGNDDE